jgi:hypothetical protein
MNIKFAEIIFRILFQVTVEKLICIYLNYIVRDRRSAVICVILGLGKETGLNQNIAVYTGYVVTENEENMNMGQYYS